MVGAFWQGTYEEINGDGKFQRQSIGTSGNDYWMYLSDETTLLSSDWHTSFDQISKWNIINLASGNVLNTTKCLFECYQSHYPSTKPTRAPSKSPTKIPTKIPTSGEPSHQPTGEPHSQPSTTPTIAPTSTCAVFTIICPEISETFVRQAPHWIRAYGEYYTGARFYVAELPPRSPVGGRSWIFERSGGLLVSSYFRDKFDTIVNWTMLTSDLKYTDEISCELECSKNSIIPTAEPTVNPSSSPTKVPSSVPSEMPTVLPSKTPSTVPTVVPSGTPTRVKKTLFVICSNGVVGMFVMDGPEWKAAYIEHKGNNSFTREYMTAYRENRWVYRNMTYAMAASKSHVAPDQINEFDVIDLSSGIITQRVNCDIESSASFPPTHSPSNNPTNTPTDTPSLHPSTSGPTPNPTECPSQIPSTVPTYAPTENCVYFIVNCTNNVTGAYVQDHPSWIRTYTSSELNTRFYVGRLPNYSELRGQKWIMETDFGFMISNEFQERFYA